LVEIIYVDDDSPDRTWELVRDIAKRNPAVKLIHRTKERGLASAIKTGVDAAMGNVIVWMDCDLALPPEIVPLLVAQLDDYELAIGSRYVDGGNDGRPFFRALLSRVFNLYTNLLLNFRVKDYTSGFIAVRREVFEDVPIRPFGFGEYFLDFAYRCTLAGKRITEVGYHFTTRQRGTSKCDDDYRTLFRHGYNFGMHVLRIRVERARGSI
jgi:dolichol-phosphate mannosyltransferase